MCTSPLTHPTDHLITESNWCSQLQFAFVGKIVLNITLSFVCLDVTLVGCFFEDKCEVYVFSAVRNLSLAITFQK